MLDPMKARGIGGGTVLAIALAAAWGCSQSDDDPSADGAPGDDGDRDGGGDDGGEARFSLLIRGDRFPRLVMEVDAVPGMEPAAGTLTDLAASLDDLLDKPGGVDVAMDGALEAVGSDHAWTFDELEELADETFDLALPGESIAVHLLYLDGHSADDGEGGLVLGIAWSHTHIAIFQQTILAACSGSVLPAPLRDLQCGAAEASILTHEMGHLLGLVDNGLPMVTPHRDPDHGRHDADDGCVMYWAYDGSALFDAIGERLLDGEDGSIGFDAACLADLAAERDR